MEFNKPSKFQQIIVINISIFVHMFINIVCEQPYVRKEFP